MNKFIEIVFPIYANHIKNKKIQNKIDCFFEGEKDIVSNDRIKGDFVGAYKERYSETFKIKDKLEDKAKTNVIGITIAVSLILGASSIMDTIYGKYSNTFIEWFAFGIFLIAVIYMISAGILAIQVLIANNIMYFVNIETQIGDEQALILEYESSTHLNQLQNLKRNNSIFTSYECIRNALVCLFLIFIIVIIPVKSPEKTINENWLINADTNSQYEFLYSTMAFNFIKNNDIQKNVEDTIIDDVEQNKDTFNSNEYFGIADNINKIYIKYRYTDNVIDVLLIELISNLINP